MQEQNDNIQEMLQGLQIPEEDEQILKELAEFKPEDYAEMNRLMTERATLGLEDKYGETFTATLIGDRFNKDRAKVYLHPDREEALVFTALVYFDGNLEDDYPAGIHLFKTEQDLQACLMAAGMTAAANCVFPGSITNEDNTALSLEDFAAKHQINRMLCRLIFPTGTKKEEILPVLEDFSNGLPVDLMINGFMLDEEAFAKCSVDFMTYPSVSEDMIRDYNPTGTFRLFVSKGKGTWMSE